MQNRKNWHLEPHYYQIYYVNIDLRHLYGISVAEKQTFLLAKRPCHGSRGEERVEQLFSQAIWEQGACMQHIDHVSS